MAKLVKLPDGSHVDARYVVLIRAPHPACDGIRGRIPPRVIVGDARQVYCMYCESFEDAEALRDRIAEAVNKERS